MKTSEKLKEVGKYLIRVRMSSGLTISLGIKNGK